MKNSFTALLAKRYVMRQKRHSLLTTLSIAAEVTLITALLTFFSTVFGCFRDIVIDRMPHHCEVYDLTEEQAEELKKFEWIESLEYKKAENDRPSHSYIMLNGKIQNIDAEITSAVMSVKHLENTPENYDSISENMYMNQELLMLDYIGDSGRLEFLQMFSIIVLCCIIIASLARLIIDTAFEISSKERERQFGILKSIGATPKQIRGVIVKEGALLSVVGIPLGMGLGILAGFIIYKIGSSTIINIFLHADEQESAEYMKTFIQFHLNPLFLITAALISFIWVMLSAYGTGMRISKKSAISSISNRSDKIKKVGKARLSKKLFGWTGVICSRNVRREKKRFVITVLSITVSLTIFAGLNFGIDVYNTQAEAEYRDMMELYDDELGQQPDMVASIINSHYAMGVDKKTYFDLMNKIENCPLFESVELFGGYTYGGSFDIDKESLNFEYEDPPKYPDLKDENYPSTVKAMFVSRKFYDEKIADKTNMTYDNLIKQNGAIALSEKYGHKIKGLNVGDKIKCTQQDMFDSEQIQQLPKDTKLTYDEESDMYLFLNKTEFKIGDTISKDVFYEGTGNDSEETYPYNYESLCIFIPIENMTNYFDDRQMYGRIALSIKFADGVSMAKAKNALNEISMENISIDDFGYIAKLNDLVIVSAAKIIGTALAALIFIIALVNFINIISTGIINRRGEIAAMRSIGMSRKQLRKMLVLENLQYSLISGIASAVITELTIFAISAFMDIAEIYYDETNYFALASKSQPLLYIAAGTVIVFIIGYIITSHLLKKIDKTSITESIRSVE